MKLKLFFPLIVLLALLFVFPAIALAQDIVPPDGLEPVAPFFSGYSLNELYLLIVGGLIGVVQGFFPGLSLFQLVKKWLKVQDLLAVVVVIVLCVVISVIALFLLGYFTSDILFDAELLASMIFAVFSMSQVGYQALKNMAVVARG